MDDEGRNPIDLGSKFKVNFGSLFIRPCGHNTDYSLSPINACMRPSVTLCLLDTIQTAVFAQSLSNLTHIVTYMDNERRNPIDLELRGQRSRSTLAHFGPCGHNTDYSLSPITFKLLKDVSTIVDDEKRKPIDLGSQCQSTRSTLALCIYNYKTLWT